jgi:erythromycin esterase-like protein
VNAYVRGHRDDRTGSDDRAKAGFHGLDVYSLHRSAAEVIAYLGGQRHERTKVTIGQLVREGHVGECRFIGFTTYAGFDAVIHVDETRAVEPLERTALWDYGEPPETYPFAV